MADRKTALRNIAVGDIFHAEAPNGASLICLTRRVTETIIYARRVTTQSYHEFDRATGVEECERDPCTIDSATPLPADIHRIILGLDRKYREAEYRRAEDPDRPWDPGESRLTDDQKRGLLFVVSFYRENPI